MMFSPTRETLNLPENLYEDYTQVKATTPWSFFSSSSASAASSSTPPVRNFDPIISPPPNVDVISRWIHDLACPYPIYRQLAMQNLVRNRNKVEMLPVLLWHSTGTVHMMLQEVIDLYKKLSEPVLDEGLALHVFNIFLLFQCIAHHPETRGLFLKAYVGWATEMPHCFFPFMDVGYADKAREYLRVGALGIIAHLMKAPVDEAATRFLMDTGAFRYCTRPVHIGCLEAKTLAVFILQKLLATDEGLNYCCILVDRFYAINDLLRDLLFYVYAMRRPSGNLFGLIVACYARLSQKDRARAGLKRCTPPMLLDGTFANLLAEDPIADNYRKELIKNLE